MLLVILLLSNAFFINACSSREKNIYPGSVLFEFNEKEIPIKYSFIPHNDAPIMNGQKCQYLNIGEVGSSNYNGMLFEIAVLTGGYFILKFSEIIYHQIDSTRYYLTINDADFKCSYEINPGINRISLMDVHVNRLNNRMCNVIISACGRCYGTKAYSARVDNGKLELHEMSNKQNY